MQVHEKQEQTPSEVCEVGGRGFACVPLDVVFALVAATLLLSAFPHKGSRHGGPVKRRQKKMGGRREVDARPSSTGQLKMRRELSPTEMKIKKRKILAVFHLLFIWMLSLLLVCLLLWNSVISLILKFKYINFYLVYRYLLNFSVGEFVWECV